VRRTGRVLETRSPPRSVSALRVKLSTLAIAFGVAVLLCSCSSSSDTAQKVDSWVSSTGLSAGIAQIRSDATNVGKVERTMNPGAIRTDCAALDLDTESANQNLPSPDDQLTTELSDAYSAEIQAAQDCFRGAGKSESLIARGQIAQSAADSDISEALSLVEQLTGKPV
jgi:hypothetical protein